MPIVYHSFFPVLHKFLGIAWLCITLPLCSFGYEMAIVHVQSGKYTTQVILQAPIEGASSPLSSVGVTIRFTNEKTGHQVVTWQKSLDFSANRVQRLPFTLLEGVYRVQVSVDARPYPELFTRQYLCHAPTAPLAASDVVLSYSPVTEVAKALPLFSPSVQINQPALFFGMALNTTRYKGLTARMVLYRKNQDGALASTYTSVQQTNQILPAATQSLSDRIDLSALSAGQYLLEVLIYQDKTLLVERTASFEIAWRGYARVFADIGLSIAQMRYAFPIATCNRLLALPKAAQYAAFSSAWRTRYGDRADAEMEVYYQKIFEAERLYKRWDSPRSDTYIRYGSPDNIVLQGGQEVWEYRKWNGRIVQPN